MLYLKYLSWKFLKLFLSVFLSLEIFFVGIDFLVKSNDIPDSANSVILFFYYNALYASTFLIPIALLITQVLYQYLISQKNQLVAFYSIGYSKKMIFLPQFFMSLLITISFVALLSTEFAYSKNNLDEITKGSNINKIKQDFFVKFENKYIYFGKFYPLLKKAENIKIYELNDGKVTRLISADVGFFNGEFWIFSTATETIITDNIETKVEIKEYSTKIEIDGFKPNIFNKVYDLHEGMSIKDAFEAIKTLQEQHISTGRIIASLFTMVLFPFLPVLLNAILFYHLPISQRDNKLMFYTIFGIFISISLWGIFFILGRLSVGGVIAPEIGILIPMLIIALVSVIHYAKIKN